MRVGNGVAPHAGVMAVGREPGGPAAEHRAGCAALPRTVPRAGSPRWQAAACKTLSVCYLPSRTRGDEAI